MARIRTIKPAFFRHRRLFLAEQETGLPLRVAYVGLWTCADREGRFRWEPDELKLDCLPYDQVDFSRVLDALATRGFIVRYAYSGRNFGFIPSWKEHQSVNNKELPSNLPEPSETAALHAMPTRGSPALERPEGNMEYGIWNMEEETTVPSPPAAASATVLRLVPEETGRGRAPNQDDGDPDDDIPSALDRRSYPDQFEDLWREYRAIANPNASKFNAHKAWAKLNATDRADCWRGVIRYVVWLGDERKRRPDHPVQHLATFINGRGWEPYLEMEAVADAS